MKEREKIIFRTSLTGIIANIFLSAFKALIGWFSKSIAITLDAVNNLTDAVSSIITMVGIKLAGRDPDKKHPFGHGRTEYLSTLAIGIIIIYAGITAGIESVKKIIHPTQSEYSGIMLIILGVAIVVKILLGLFYIGRGKKVNSGSLKASGKDALFDAIISAGTIVAAVVFITTGVSLEAYLGIIIAGLIIKSGVETLVETVSKIIGEGASPDLVKEIKKEIKTFPGVNGAYDLVFHNYGQDIYVASIHIEVIDGMDANEIDILSRTITEHVYQKFGVLLTAVGIYSFNTHDEEIISMRQRAEEIALSHKHVNQIHAFYVNKNEHKMRFDMVISFDEKNRAELYQHVIQDLQKEFPEYQIAASMDSDFNEI